MNLHDLRCERALPLMEGCRSCMSSCQLSANNGRFLILRDLRLQILDLRVQASAHGRQLLDRGGQVRDAGLGLGDGGGLLLVVRLTPRQRCNMA